MSIITRIVGNVVVLSLCVLGARDVVRAVRKWHTAYKTQNNGPIVTQ